MRNDSKGNWPAHHKEAQQLQALSSTTHLSEGRCMFINLRTPRGQLSVTPKNRDTIAASLSDKVLRAMWPSI